MVVFDTTFLSLLFYEKSRPPLDPSSKQPIERAKDRIEYLIETLDAARQKIVIPTPVLTELLAISSKSQELLEKINSSRWFFVYPFDQKAAIECSELIRTVIKPAEKKNSTSTWAKAKFDYQIIAIAIVAGADAIYTDDEDIHRRLAGKRIKGIRISELPFPPPRQMPLPDAREPNKD
jgi:predicted nucleic acid-binding protein